MHVAIIMDGNRRYAKNNLLATIDGHRKGMLTLRKIVESSIKNQVQTLTVYALSSENLLKRSDDEISNIFKVMKEAIVRFKRELIGTGVRVKILGKINNLPKPLQEAMMDLAHATEQGANLLLQVCINYGGRMEIVEAAKKAVANNEEINEESINKYLFSKLEPDLLIRPGGEYRLSNFLTWQTAYSELYFTNKLWPEFSELDYIDALNFFRTRQRRFGE
jgi:undecaprenyl diphosphate synthase